MNRVGTARWEGDLKQGHGELTVGDKAWTAPYSFGTRFGDDPGTNPEELLAAAHAACYSMAFANELSKAGAVPRSVETRATVRLDSEGGYRIAAIALATRVDVASLPTDEVTRIGAATRDACPVSKALSAVPITVTIERVGA